MNALYKYFFDFNIIPKLSFFSYSYSIIYIEKKDSFGIILKSKKYLYKAFII